MSSLRLGNDKGRHDARNLPGQTLLLQLMRDCTNSLLFDQIPPERRLGVKSAVTRIESFIKRGVLKPDAFIGKRVLDWECGRGDFAVAYLLLGAREVVGTDTWLDEGGTARLYADIKAIRFQAGDIRGQLAAHTIAPGTFDLVFTNTVTEHLQELAHEFLAVNSAVKTGGAVFLNHQNYYGPSGHHDFAFVDDIGGGAVGQKSVTCWDKPEKCEASREYRLSIAKTRPWMWTNATNERLTPEDCSLCLYQKRSKPWAHLLHQGDFIDVYPLPNYAMGKPRSSLNKITLFQLRQMVVEAGFLIVGTDKTYCTNEPPEQLLKSPYFFSRDELKTWMYRIFAIKAHDVTEMYGPKEDTQPTSTRAAKKDIQA